MIKLTQTVQKGGCAAKVAASELREILKRVEFPPRKESLLVDGSTFDDAAIEKISEDLALVQTLDFFTPIVDSPTLFGEIAAANALSDVYAMGGRPQTAMAILAYPTAVLDQQVIADVLNGACKKITEAGAMLVGGHSIDDDTLKFGLSVTGYVHPKKVWSNAGAQPGDHLILTKPLGTGTASAALKRGEVSEVDIEPQLASMAKLNRAIDFMSAESKEGIHAATDITGFGLLGHSLQLARASGVHLNIFYSALPAFPKTFDFFEKGFLTKAHRTNRTYTEASLKLQGLNDLEQLLLFDPQTSGGLLIAVDPKKSSLLLQEIRKGFPDAEIVGEVLSRKSDEATEVRVSKKHS